MKNLNNENKGDQIMKKDEMRIRLVYNLLSEDLDNPIGDKWVEISKKSMGDSFNKMKNKYNRMSIERFEDYIRGAYETEEDSSLDPKPNEMILNGINEIKKEIK